MKRSLLNSYFSYLFLIHYFLNFTTETQINVYNSTLSSFSCFMLWEIKWNPTYEDWPVFSSPMYLFFYSSQSRPLNSPIPLRKELSLLPQSSPTSTLKQCPKRTEVNIITPSFLPQSAPTAPSSLVLRSSSSACLPTGCFLDLLFGPRLRTCFEDAAEKKKAMIQINS